MKKERPRKEKERLQQKTAGAGTRIASSPPTRRRILVIDDDLEDLLRYSAILQHEGYEVRSIASHKEADNCISREKFDLIIVSQGTAAFEGRSILARAFERNQRVPVIVLSRSSDTDYCPEAMQMGAADCRKKPAAACEVAEIAGRHLGLSKTQAV